MIKKFKVLQSAWLNPHTAYVAELPGSTEKIIMLPESFSPESLARVHAMIDAHNKWADDFNTLMKFFEKSDENKDS